MSSRLSCIAVDLTPVLPGGENGGAKIFVLELLRRLAAMRPTVRFLLLTQAGSHDELAWLDGPNTQRLMVVGAQPPAGVSPPQPGLKRLAKRVLPHLPEAVRRAVRGAAERFRHSGVRHSESLLGSHEIDLLFCPFTAPTYFRPDVPTVCTIYDLQYKTYPEFFAPEEVGHRDRVFLAACRQASALTAISDYSRDSAVQHGKLEPHRIRTIHLRMAQRIAAGGVDGTAVLGRHGLQPGGYLLFPANFWRHKNHEMALTAFGMAVARGLPPQMRLVCTGAPTARQQWLAQAAAAMGLRDRILFPGYVSEAELAALLGHSAGMVFPSLYEGFGLPVVEAMAAGVPVACSNSTSLPEVAAGAALLFDPRLPEEIAECMVRLTTDKELRTRLVAQGRQRAEEFADSDRMAREYWQLFEFALANQRQENGLTGAYADGWSSPVLNLQVAPAAQPRTVEFHLSAPAWLPEAVGVRAWRRGKPHGNPMTLQRGSSGVFCLPVDPQGGSYEVKFSPSFVPAQAGIGADERQLAALLDACSIVTATGERMQLFPERAS